MGSLSEVGLDDCSSLSMLRSLPSPDQSLNSSAVDGLGIDKNCLMASRNWPNSGFGGLAKFSGSDSSSIGEAEY